MIAKAIVEKTFEFLDGKDIKDWLEKVGECKCQWSGNTLYIQGKIRTAIYRNLDPINTFICIAMALFGVYWVWVCGDGLKLIDKEWKRRLKQAKEESKKDFESKKSLRNVNLFELREIKNC